MSSLIHALAIMYVGTNFFLVTLAARFRVYRQSYNNKVNKSLTFTVEIKIVL